MSACPGSPKQRLSIVPDERVMREVAAWPPLTEEQLDDLAPLLKELAKHVRQVRREWAAEAKRRPS